MTGAKSIKYFHFGAFYTWKSIIAGLSSFGESKAFIFLDAVHVRINGESGVFTKPRKPHKSQKRHQNRLQNGITTPHRK